MVSTPVRATVVPAGDQGPELVVLIGSRSPTGDAVRDVLADWARAELIRLCYWLTPQDWPRGVVDAWRLDADGAQPVTLPDDLGGVSWSRCRVVLVQPLTPGHAGDEAVTCFGAAYAEFLNRTILPMGTPLTRVNLLVPTSDLEPTSDLAPTSDLDPTSDLEPTSRAVETNPALLIPGWELTLVVSPEERASTEHPNVLVREECNLVPHTALAAASAAGLWVGMDGGVLDGLVPESATGEPTPRLMRSFVRVVRGGDVTGALAEIVLRPSDGRWPVPASERLEVAPAADPRAVIEQAVRDLDRIDDGALCYADPPAPLVPNRLRVGPAYVWAVFKEFWSILLRRIRDVPARIRQATEARITNVLFGPEGGHEFGFGVAAVRDRSEAVIALVREETDDGSILGQARLAERALALLTSQQRPAAPRPQAWVELRQLVLSLIDAGTFPEGVEAPVLGSTRQVIVEPARVVPDSEAPRFAMPDDVVAEHPSLRHHRGSVLAPCDPLQTAWLDRDLESVRAQLDAEVEALAAFVDQKRAEAAQLRQQLAAPAAGGRPDPSLEAQVARIEQEADTAEQQRQRARARLERIGEVLGDLRAWAAPRLDTLLWRVGETVGRHLDRATTDQREAFELLAERVELDTETVERARRRVLRSLIVWFVVAVMGSVLAQVRWELWFAPVVAAVGFVVVMVLSFVRYSRLRSVVERRFAEGLARQRNALNRLVHVAGEVARLAMIYRLYVEWAEILGYQAHHPWARPPDDAAPPAPPEPSVEPPPSLVIGAGAVEGDLLGELVGRVARRIQHEGWLAEEYRQHRGFSMERLARRLGAVADDLDPDRDGLATGARSFLLADLREHAPQRHAYQVKLDEIAELCAHLRPDEVLREVSVPGHEPGRVPVSEFLAAIGPEPDGEVPGFLVDLLASDALVQGLHDRVEVRFWAPEGIGVGPTVVHRPATTTRSGEYLLQAVRIDLSPPIDPGSLRIFSAAEEGSTPDHRDPVADSAGGHW